MTRTALKKAKKSTVKILDFIKSIKKSILKTSYQEFENKLITSIFCMLRFSENKVVEV